MKLILEMDLENDGFAGSDSEGRNGSEIARILRYVAGECKNGILYTGFSLRLFDINGNRCGSVRVEE